MFYKQTANLITTNKGEIEENTYELIFEINKLRDNEKNAVIYDKELKMYFENPSGIITTYEIEIKKVRADLCKRLKKSEEFNRRLFLRYDWIRIQVNTKGEIISIDNKEEIKATWKKLKAKIQTNTKGDYVDKYLSRIDDEINSTQAIYPIFNQYFMFGLLFPRIPRQHSASLQRERIVEFSPYERESFKELLSCVSFNNDKPIYTLKGSTLNESRTNLIEYSGHITRNINSVNPEQVNLSIEYEKDRIHNIWNFDLYEINF